MARIVAGVCDGRKARFKTVDHSPVDVKYPELQISLPIECPIDYSVMSEQSVLTGYIDLTAFYSHPADRGSYMLNDVDGEELRALLAAAEILKPKLLSLLTLGPDALDNYAYAIKARVKAHDSAVAKICDKRAKGKPDYAPSRMTDVIGVRILCLWPDDISVVLERLIRIIHEISQTGLSSFSGGTLAEILTEVIVYKAANSPAVYDVIGKQLTTWLLTHGRASDCVRIEDSPRERPYSSVHLVVWCRAQTAGRWMRVPVEFQVRTSLEDVWSEVDHRLRYKSRAVEIDGRLANVGNSLLDQLKVHLDVAATTVISARELFTPAPPNPSASLARIVPEGSALVRWGASEASGGQQDTAIELNNAVDTFYAEFEKDLVPSSTDWNTRLTVLVDTIRAAIRSRAIDPSPSADDEKEFFFASRMELGQALLWQARLMRTSVEDDARTLGKIEVLTEACLKTYLELINSKQFEHSALLWFRFGNALLDLRGDFEQASIYLRRAHGEMATDLALAGTPLSIAVPRLFAYSIWRQQNNQYLRSIALFGPQSAAAQHSLPAIREALVVMTPLLDAIDDVTAVGSLWNPDTERLRIANNLLSYAWYFGLMDARSKGHDAPRQNELSEAVLAVISKNFIKKAYSILLKSDNDGPPLTTINRTHTLATTAFILKDRKALASYVESLRTALSVSAIGNNAGTDALQMQTDLAVLDGRED